MKTLCITDVRMPGGVDTYIQQLVVTKMNLNEHIDLYLLIDDQKGADKLYGATNILLKDKCLRRGIASNYHPDIIKANLEEILQAVKPDVVHVICGWPRSALVIREYLANKEIPFFFTESLIDENWDFSKAIADRIINLYHKAINVFTVSENNAAIIKSVYGWPSEKIVSIPNGVDTAIVKPKERWSNISKFVTVSRLDDQKGIDVLIQAVHQLPQSYKNRVNFTIWGEGENRQGYEQLIEQYGLSQIIHMPGWNDHVMNELCNYDCFILPSRFEGMPIALIEAMAAKLLCIAARVSGIPEVLQNGKYGMMFENGSIDELCAHICYCIDHMDFCKNMALQGHEHVLKNHDCYQNMEQIIYYWKNKGGIE